MRFASGLIPQLWLNTLREVEEPNTHSIKEWLASGAYAVSTIPSSSSFAIFVHNERQFCEKLAVEINKWASATFETVASIRGAPVNKRAIAWPLIKVYYASFFAAHTIMRIFGRSCSQLEGNHTQGIVMSGRAVDPTARLSNGFYRLRYDKSLGIVTGDLMNDSHADTWCEFFHLIDELSRDVLMVEGVGSVKIETASVLDGLKDVLINRGSSTRGNWLSQFRNQVNYHKSYGVWYPYGKELTLLQAVQILDRWKNRRAEFNFNTGDGKVRQFLEATTFILWLVRELVLLLSESRVNNGHFLDHGALNFLRFAKWH